MFAKFIATLAGAAMMITAAGARPVAADERDLARALALIAGVAIVSKIISDNKQDKRDHVATRNNNQYQQHYYTPQRPAYVEPIQPRPLPQKAQRKLLPGDCLRSYNTRDGRVRMFGQRCLQNQYRYVNRLPEHCAIRVRTSEGPRRGYEARCLRDQGYRLAHR
jgi:hypothetical protein